MDQNPQVELHIWRFIDDHTRLVSWFRARPPGVRAEPDRRCQVEPSKGRADFARPFVWMARLAGSSGETAQLPVHCGLVRTRPIATLVMGRWVGGLIATPTPSGRAEVRMTMTGKRPACRPVKTRFIRGRPAGYRWHERGISPKKVTLAGTPSARVRGSAGPRPAPPLDSCRVQLRLPLPVWPPGMLADWARVFAGIGVVGVLVITRAAGGSRWTWSR
jgi:hypothetical protein